MNDPHSELQPDFQDSHAVAYSEPILTPDQAIDGVRVLDYVGCGGCGRRVACPSTKPDIL